MWALMCRKRVSRDELAEILWPDPDDMPETSYNNIKVNIHWARQALRGSEWRIVSDKNRCYMLERAKSGDDE